MSVEQVASLKAKMTAARKLLELEIADRRRVIGTDTDARSIQYRESLERIIQVLQPDELEWNYYSPTIWQAYNTHGIKSEGETAFFMIAQEGDKFNVDMSSSELIPELAGYFDTLDLAKDFCEKANRNKEPSMCPLIGELG